MGKVSAAAETVTPKKKKGRPSLLDLQKRNQQQQFQNHKQNPPIFSNNNRNRRSNQSLQFSDDDDERQQKKVKLVVRLPQSIQQPKPKHQHYDKSDSNSDSGLSDSDDDPQTSPKKRKFNGSEEEKVAKATDTLHGSPLESGPTTTPLPDKKLLVFIMDRLRKKDTHGVFSEPVDPNELPDYHEIIKHPMDFGTVRRKLDGGLYLNLEQLEADVFLICSNAMQYNSSDTVFYRQARSIQDLAKRDFENLRHEGDDGELQPKVIRRGRPPGKHVKKPVGSTSVERTAPEHSSGATLASAERTVEPTVEDNTNVSSGYNLRRAPPLYRFQSPDAIHNSQRSRNGDYSEWLADWNDEFPASILRADMKYGKKNFTIDETRRDTYKQFHTSAFSHEPSLLSDLGGNTKQLIPVGLHMEHSCARSLARFAANLGPVVWKIASKKLETVLPPRLKYGPGFVGENEASLRSPVFSFEKQSSSTNLSSDGNPTRPVTPSISGVNPVVPSGSLPKEEEMAEVDGRFSSPSELTVLRSASVPGAISGPNKPLYNPDRNGFKGAFGYNLASQMGLVRRSSQMGQSVLEEASVPGLLPKTCSASTHSTLKTEPDPESVATLRSCNFVASSTGSELHKVTGADSSGGPAWKAISPHHRQHSLSIQPDLNLRVQAPGSPNSGLRVDSPQHPDLALQL